jgi:hypothetical protein
MATEAKHDITAAVRLRQLVIDHSVSGVRVGVSSEDPRLWAFATQLQADEEEMKEYEREFAGFFEQFSNVLRIRLRELHGKFPSTFPWHANVGAKKAGSVRNLTHLTHPDLDVLVVLNEGQEFKYVSESNQLVASESVVTSAAIVQLVNTVTSAINEYIDGQRRPHAFTLDTFRIQGKTRFTFKTAASLQSLGLEFDLLPVLEATNGSCFLLDGSGGIQRTDNELAAREIARLSIDFVGLREMMKVLKLVLKATIRQKPTFAHLLPSCCFEMATIRVAKAKKRGWWDTASFTEIFRTCLDMVKKSLEEGTALPAPNDPESDVLAHLKSSVTRKAVVNDFLALWMNVDAKSLGVALEECLATLNTASASTHSPPTEAKVDVDPAQPPSLPLAVQEEDNKESEARRIREDQQLQKQKYGQRSD